MDDYYTSGLSFIQNTTCSKYHTTTQDLVEYLLYITNDMSLYLGNI